MLEIRLPGVLQSVQEALRRQSAARELQRKKDAVRQARLQALEDEVELIKNTPLIPTMKRAASLLRSAYKDVSLTIDDPKHIIENSHLRVRTYWGQYETGEVGVCLSWRIGPDDKRTQAEVLPIKDETGKILGFDYNHGSFRSDLSLEKISEAVDKAVVNPSR